MSSHNAHRILGVFVMGLHGGAEYFPRSILRRCCPCRLNRYRALS